MKLKSVTFSDNVAICGEYQKQLVSGDRYSLELVGEPIPYAVEVTHLQKQKTVCIAFPAVKQWEPDDQAEPLPAEETKEAKPKRGRSSKVRTSVPGERADS